MGKIGRMRYVSEIDDPEFQEETIASVGDYGDRWDICTKEGWHLAIPKTGPKPKTGDRFRTYGKGFGFPVRGVAVNEYIIFYKTAEQAEAEHKERVAEQKAQARIEYENNKDDIDSRVKALPGPFQERIIGFRNARPDSFWEHEGYELFVCEEAAKMSEHFEGADDFERWTKLNHAEQRAEFSVSDEH